MGSDYASAREEIIRHRGLFICLEGIDGAGKTTAVGHVVEALGGRRIPAVVFDKKITQFGSEYVRRHAGELRALIWEHPADDPYLELGDMHWVYLQAAWYSAAAHCAVRPLLEAGQVVVTDTWTYKFLAKLAMRPNVDLRAAAAVFDGLPQPDLVVRLDLDPVTAADRKTTFGISEAGNHEGDVALTREAFIGYQRRLAEVLDAWTLQYGWMPLDVNGMSPQDVGAAVAELAVAALGGRRPGSTSVVTAGR
ncbi:dTMP kinase [Micromonospora haikouensis]|uniref:dTMP kinase n=1 Tax=Micromonospora haikouensis TaxID=686309 RepID=UPI003793F3D7